MGAVQSFISPKVIATVNDSPNQTSLAAFSPGEFRFFKIRSVRDISHNTKSFIIDLQSPLHETGLFASSFVMVKGSTSPEGKFVVRPYTPISTNDDKGYFELLVKMYPGGAVSEYIYNRKVGDHIEVKGPLATFRYAANSKKSIGMLAGGSGITPMIQIIKAIVNNPDDTTSVTLIYANSTEKDILLHSELKNIVQSHSNIKIIFIVSRPEDSSWSGPKGRINPEIISANMPKPDSCHIIYVSGPPSFMESISGTKTPDKKQGLIGGYLKDAGYTEEMVWKF